MSQNELDAKQISDSVKNFFDRFHVSQFLKASNVKKNKGELLAKVFDHANHAFLYGFRMLTQGWTDGNTFLPVSHVLLSSENKRRINDANAVDRRCNGYRRRKLALSKGTDAMIDLIREARKALQ